MTAFKATFSDMKLIKTREVTQLIFEIPTQEFDAAYEVLGGVPISGKERWFAIAALKVSPAEKEPATPRQTLPKPDGAKRDWQDVPAPQQAGIRIGQATFAAYLREEHSDEWHETGDPDSCLKLICRINSKREFLTNHKAYVLWRQIDGHYDAWLAKERVGA